MRSDVIELGLDKHFRKIIGEQIRNAVMPALG
jgi:hypothetical protein